MNYKKIHYSIFISIFMAVTFTTSSAYADEEVILESDEQAQEIFMGRNWTCEWGAGEVNGTSEVIYEKAKLKKMIAKVKSSYCPDGWGKSKGKYKKGKMYSTLSNLPSPCNVTNRGVSKLYKANDGSYYYKGTYSNQYTQAGVTTCKEVPKN